MSSISAGTTTTTAFKITSDTTGSLVLKTGASGVTAVDIDASQVVTIGNIAVTGGTINNTIIGGTTAAAGTFTTLSAASTVTLNGGTANGVAYLNGSKNLTTGSALVFDGTNLGIGTSSPSFSLDINTGTNDGRQIRLNGTSNNALIRTSSTTRSYSTGTNSSSWIVYDDTGSAYRLVVDSSGNLGIGTASPAAKLHVLNSSGVTLTLEKSGGAALQFVNSGGNGYQIDDSSGAMRWLSGGSTERMRLDSSGNLGITQGNAPTQALNLYRTGSTQTVMAVGNSGTGLNGTYFGIDTGGNAIINQTQVAAMYFSTSNAERMRITSGGDVGVGTSSPVAKFHAKGTAVADVLYRLEPVNNSYASKLLISSQSSGDGGIRYGSGGSNLFDIFSYGDMRFFCGTANLSGAVGDERMRLTQAGNLGIGTSSPESILHIAQASSGGLGAQFILDNTAGSALNNAVEISFLTDGGASGSGTRNARIRAVNENAGNGAANMQFWTWNGSADAERARITAAGDVIVNGTTVLQSAKLSVHSGSIAAENSGVDGTYENAFIGVYASNNNEHNVIQTAVSSGGTLSGFRFRASLGGGSSTTYPVLDLTRDQTIFYTANSERARITSGGALCINSTSTTYSEKLKVDGGIGGYAVHTVKNDTGSQGHFVFSNPNGAVGSIFTNGTATSYNTSSDRRLKDNIVPAPSASSVVNAIQVISHDWKAGGHTRYGVIAQDLYEVAPEAVKVGDSGEEVKDIWGVDYSKLVPILVKAIQELKAELDALKGSN